MVDLSRLDDDTPAGIDTDAVLGAGDALQFTRLYDRYVESTKPGQGIELDKVKPPASPMTCDLKDLEPCPDDAMLHHELLQKLVIVKLNGGLGASMGCEGPKSAVEVRSGATFLDMTVRQVEFLNSKYGTDVPLILMNSFHTHSETVKIVKKYSNHHISMHCFQQSAFPRIDYDSLSLLPTTEFDPASRAGRDGWYPPGHGDVFYSLEACGMLNQLLHQGKEYVFISNVDNLGAAVDLSIMYHLMNEDIPFAMEVTRRMRVDTQGGVLVNYDGKPMLLERAQVPKNALSAFADAARQYQTFNTNNLWVGLAQMKHLLESRRLDLEPIPVQTTVNGKRVLQLETAAGSAIKFFDRAVGINVPRSRFMPVKSTSDLLRVRSDLYNMTHGRIQFNPLRSSESIPIVKLGPEFQTLASFYERFEDIPTMLELDHLTVQGNVHFGKNVVLRGTVIIVAHEGCRIDIPDGTVLEHKVVTGHLRILDH